VISEVYVVHSIDRTGTRIMTQVTDDLDEARDTARTIVETSSYPRADITCWWLGGSWFIAENVTGFERDPDTGAAVSTATRPAGPAPAPDPAPDPAPAPIGLLDLMAGGFGS
jgi:hypothetical protein